MTSLAPTYRIAVVAALAMCAQTIAPRAAAIVVVATDSQDHAIVSSDNPGWANVTSRGVYIGNRWMLTAGHVGAGPTTFDGNPNPFAVEGAGVPLTNPSGMDMFADLVMYRLSTDPGLPSLSIGAATPAAGARVTLIGSGQGLVTDNSTASESHWNRTGTAPNYTYTPVMSGGNIHGFMSAGGGKRWGTNLVETDGRSVPADAFPDDDNFGETVSFLTRFDKVPYTLNDPSLVTDSEAQAQSGDSGSGVFFKVGDDWTLVGITFAVGLEDNQPGGTTTALYGNYTVIGDLSFYRDQILSISAVPEVGGLALTGAASALVACGIAIRRQRRTSAPRS